MVSKGNLIVVDELDYDQLITSMRHAKTIITHGGPASIFLAWKLGKIPYVLPRKKQYHEHVDDHQVYFANYLYRQKRICLLDDELTLFWKHKKQCLGKPRLHTSEQLIHQLHEYVQQNDYLNTSPVKKSL
jgi:UDP-N-acetylglucosamine transferase subunit ALG13